MHRRLAEAWDTGYKAGRQGRPVVEAPRVERSRWDTAYARGVRSATDATATALQTLAVHIDAYSRDHTAERLKKVKRALAHTRQVLRSVKQSPENSE